MGVINITMRSASRGTIGNIESQRTVDYGRVAEIDARTIQMQADQTSRGLSQLGNLGNTMIGFAASMQRESDDRKVDKYVNQFQNNMETYNNNSEIDPATGVAKGAMHVNFDDSQKWRSDNVKWRDKMASDLKDQLGLNNRQMEKARARLANYNTSWDNRWNERAYSVDKKNSTDNAKGTFANFTKTILDGNAPAGSYDDWYRAGERLMDVSEIMAPEARKAFMNNEAMKLVQGAVDQGLGKIESECIEEEDSTKVKGKYDAYLKIVENGGDEALIPPDGRNAVMKAIGDQGIGNYRKKIIDLVKQKRNVAVHNADARWRMNKQQSRQDAADAEIRWTQTEGYDQLTESQKADWYRELCRQNAVGEDGTSGAQYPLEKYDKTSYLLYQRKAEYWDKMAKSAERKDAKDLTKAAKDAIKANDDYFDKHALQYLVFPRGNMTPKERENWLDNRRHMMIQLYDAAKRGQISDEKSKQINSMLETHWKEEDQDALRHMLHRFGINIGDGMEYQSVNQAMNDMRTHKDKPTDAILGVDEGWFWDTEKRIGTQDLCKYVQHFAYLLSTMEKGADKRKFATDCEDEIVRLYLADSDADEFLDAITMKYNKAKAEEKSRQDAARRNVLLSNQKKETK